MSAANAVIAHASFEIKSANLALLALRLRTTDLAVLEQELTQKYGDVPDFFDNEPLVIDLTALPADASSPNFVALIKLLRRYRLAPVAFKNADPALGARALAAGLAAAPDTVIPSSARTEATPEEAPPVGLLPALVIDKPLRSGQRVYARDCDLVMLAMVNSGAEVIADGHIHVYAPLRGKAIAGARGNADARIFAISMEPELISIAGIYRTSENPLPSDIKGRPAQVRLVVDTEGDRLVMEALK